MSKKSIKNVLTAVDSYKPTITFDVKQVPELKNWKVHSKHTLTVSLELVALSDEDYDERLNGRFKVLKVTAEK